MDHSNNDYIRDLRSTEFSATLPDVKIAATDRTLVTVRIDGETVFEEYLWPVDGSIVLEDLRGLVEPYCDQRQTVALEVNDQKATVVCCHADFGDETAEHYLANHFLSILQGRKLTALGRLEILPVQGSEAASCLATYSDGTTKTFAVKTYLAATSGRKFTEYDASPQQFVAEGKTLMSYVVSVGSRQQEYAVDPDAPDCAPILIFENSFGVEEVVYCTGLHRVDPSYKRSAAYIGRHQRNYRIDETRAFHADTGPLTTAMAAWLDDLFRSQYVRVANLYDGEVVPGKEVLITDSKSEISNDDAAMPRFTFTYQYAQRNHNVVQMERAGRIFDNTFDNTFN